MSTRRAQTNSAAWLTVVCIAMLLAATTAQAGHFCGFPIPDANGGSQVASSRSAVCLICLMASSAMAAIMLVVFFPCLRGGARAWCPRVQPRPFLESFQLYVRPPPAY